MDLQQLRTFVAIAEAGGITKAMQRLNLSQPALSRQMQTLEAEWGLALFLREGRQMRLTAVGEDLLRNSRRVLSEAQSLRDRVQALKSGESGVLRIGATPPMIEAVLSPFLAGYRSRHPDVEVHVVEDGGTTLAHRLEQGEVHVAYIPVGDDRFRGRLLYPIHVVAAIAADSPFKRPKRFGLEIGQLAQQPLVLLRQGFGSRDWFDAACQAADLRPTVLLESGSHNVVLGLARAGYGIGVLPSGIPEASEGVDILPLLHEQRPLGKWTMLAWHARRYLPPYAEIFADELTAFARERYAARPFARRAPAIPKPASA